MKQTWVVEAQRVINGIGSLESVLQLEAQVAQLDAVVRPLTIDPLAVDWHSPLAPGHYRSGCAPLEALAEARRLIGGGECDAVVIQGCDPLASGYDRAERLRRMAIYGPDYPLTQAYNDLAEAFIARRGGDRQAFIRCRDALYRNYERTYLEAAPSLRNPLPAARWFEPVTSLFRGVDCANPVVDFEGRVLLCSDPVRQQLELGHFEPLKLAGVGLGQLTLDGAAAIDAIAEYEHLRQAFVACETQAGMDLARGVLERELLLEVYSCYPVVPMAFLLRSGIAASLDSLATLLETLQVTVTGGMNLARAPWNNPALNGLVTLCEEIGVRGKAGGLLHGNGGLGYRQGVALLTR